MLISNVANFDENDQEVAEIETNLIGTDDVIDVRFCDFE